MPPPGHLFDAEYRSKSEPGWTPARVRFDTRGLIIEPANGPGTQVWPYPDLESDAPVPLPGTARVVLRSREQPGATLTVDAKDFVPSIRQAAPQLTRSRTRGPAWMPMVIATLGLLALVAALVAAIVGFFPYKTVARRIPDETREKIGSLALAELTKGHKKCDAQAGNAALMRLTDRLAQASGTGIKFKVQVVDWGLVNAFTVMGNQIVLTKGLIAAASSADEVAGVLGHEMGHAIEVHPEAAVLRALGTVVGVQALFGGWSPDVVSQATTQLVLLRYSRAAEVEADDVSLRLLKEARISAAPFASFFDKLGKTDDDKSAAARVPAIFSTHPPSPERALRARAQPRYEATPALSSADWDALRRICG